MANEEPSKTTALLRWFSSFGLEATKPSQVSDGVAMAAVLHRIDASHFDEAFLAKIKRDVVDNKHLKVNNLRKILGAISEFNDEYPFVNMADFPMPNVNLAAEGSSEDMGRMLQLILGCAVNCYDKQQYIESIMDLEESVQQVIMLLIQELLKSGPLEQAHGNVVKELDASNREREELRQRCHELEIQVRLLTEDKSIMSAEVETLQAQVKGKFAAESNQSGADYQIKDLKKQIEKGQEDVYRIEKERDEYAAKVEELEKTVEEAATREAELQALADQARKLKDEVDILRETADKVDKYEASIESYKKKMEEQADLRRQLKLLESKNTALMQTNIDLEEDIKKTGNWKPQVDKYKKQINELQDKMEAETKRGDRSEFEIKKLLEKLEAISVERDRLQTERDDLKERFNEASDQLKMMGSHEPSGRNAQFERLEGDNDASMMELIPSAIKERILRLQAENKRLKQNSSQEDPLMQTMVDDLKEREARLEATNRSLNQKILELESRLEDSKGSVPRITGSREELELKLHEAGKKIAHLSETVQKKDVEMQGMEERYKKYIEKAKSVIKTLDPKQNPNAAPETMALRSQLSEKDRLLETMEQETEKARAVREMEERLISSAFYNLSMQMHRSSVENRLSNIHSTSSSHGQSFLARQRQIQQAQSAAGGRSGGSNFMNAS